MHNKWRDRGGVTPELAARVKEIAKEVGYSPWYNTAIT
jgi:DNA-binding LacI/PurR family transcriptional regulator